MQLGTEGLESYHFEKDNSYISYAAAPSMWQLDNGKPVPEKKQFQNESYNQETRTFTGIVEWSPVPFNGYSKQEYEMVFSEDLLEIEGGKVIYYDAGGHKQDESDYYGQDFFYEKLTGRYK